MSVFGTKNREEVIIGNAVAAETTAAAFIASASDQEIKVLSADGTAPAAGEDFKVFQKTATGYEVSDIVKADKVEKVILATYAAEVAKSVTVTVDTATAGQTYILEVYVLEEGGSLSPENFSTTTRGQYVSSAGDTVTTIRDGLLASLQYAIKKREDGILAASASSTDEIIVAGLIQTVVPGKNIATPIQFNVNVKSFDNSALIDENTTLMSAVTTVEASAGTGTGKYAVNLEWFTKGFANEVYREVSYPADFDTPYYASASGIYNCIHVKYYDDRNSPGVEKQQKVLTFLVDKGTDTLGNNAETNAVLGDLRTILGAGNVPADLPTA